MFKLFALHCTIWWQ